MGQSVQVLMRHECSVLPSNKFSSFLTHTHTHSITPSFSPLDYLFNLSMSAPSPARYTSLVCRLGLLLAQSAAQPHPGRFIVLSYSRFSCIISWHGAANVVNGHDSLKIMTKQIAFIPPKDSSPTSTCKLKQTHTHCCCG